MSIFVGDKASDKLVKYSFNLNILSIFKSVKIGSLWFAIFYEFLIVFGCEIVGIGPNLLIKPKQVM